MKTNFAALGAFILGGLILFTTVLFLIGNRNQAFNKHEELYVEMATVTGIAPGSKVRASGFDAGQVKSIELPPRPSAKFRVKLEVDKKLHSIIRQDSLVSVESDGLVGDKFLMIHTGTDGSPEAASGFTLPNKEPVELSAILEKVSGTIDQAKATIGDVHVKLDGALDVITSTVTNTNGLVTEARSGKGTVGMLMSDRQTADKVKLAVANVQQASVNLNQVSVQAQQLMTDVQSRNLPAKIDDTMVNARDASAQMSQVSHKVNATVTDALAPDSFGVSAAENLRDTLSNVNRTTANLADDTEALKHEFFFRGFFKKRGFYGLNDLTPAGYRSSTFFQNPRNQRFWISGAEAFTTDSKGAEVLSDGGKQQIDQIVGSAKDSIVMQPMIVEGYSNDADAARQITLSSRRALLIDHYLVQHFHLHSNDIGVVSLNSKPPQSSGKNVWDGASIILLPQQKK
jgi:phospholipid/cholesterol/gamma-HCH transport system substrate-binding protein